MPLRSAFFSLGVLSVLFASQPVQAASFDCAKAASPDEIAICRQGSLSALDSEMGGLWYAYSQVPMLMGSNGARHDEAEDFLQKRKACGADETCLRDAYHQRIVTLKENIKSAMQTAMDEQNATPDGSALSYPEPVHALLDSYGKQCSDLGGVLKGKTVHPLAADLDGDGKLDYVMNTQSLVCEGSASAFCANAGCQVDVALSGDDYAKPLSLQGGEPTLRQVRDVTELNLWVDKTNCEGKSACWATYTWNGGKSETAYKVLPQ
ncbi:MAG: hypothetical protein ACRECW_18030 [Phyllobacterium sp.]